MIKRFVLLIIVMYPNWQGNYMTYGGFQTGPVSAFVEPVPKPPLRVKLTPRERGSFNLFLSQADPDGHNRVEGPQAVEFLKRSGLPTDVLKTIWTIATPEGESFLDRERFYVALRLIALAQEGKPVSEQSIYDDIQASIPKFQSNVVVKNKWDVDTADKDKYSKMFLSLSNGKGYLTTEEAIEMFRKTQVKPEYLKKIWNLSDPTDSGEFRENQFMVAMHLVTRLKNLSEPIPDELPPPLKKIISAQPQEANKPPQNEAFTDFGMGGMNAPKNTGDAFSDFSIGAIGQMKPPEAFPTSDFNIKPVPQTNQEFGFNNPKSFASVPIKINLDDAKSSSNSMLAMKAPKIEEKKEPELIEAPPIQKKTSFTESPNDKNEAIRIQSKKVIETKPSAGGLAD